jgi:hypothetical protein
MILAGQIDKGRGANGAFEMKMQFNFGNLKRKLFECQVRLRGAAS